MSKKFLIIFIFIGVYYISVLGVYSKYFSIKNEEFNGFACPIFFAKISAKILIRIIVNIEILGRLYIIKMHKSKANHNTQFTFCDNIYVMHMYIFLNLFCNIIRDLQVALHHVQANNYWLDSTVPTGIL